MRIVETDNLGRDYPNEKFLNLPPIQEDKATLICNAINDAFDLDYPRYWKVVPNDYHLVGGFEPLAARR